MSQCTIHTINKAVRLPGLNTCFCPEMFGASFLALLHPFLNEWNGNYKNTQHKGICELKWDNTCKSCRCLAYTFQLFVKLLLTWRIQQRSWNSFLDIKMWYLDLLEIWWPEGNFQSCTLKLNEKRSSLTRLGCAQPNFSLSFYHSWTLYLCYLFLQIMPILFCVWVLSSWLGDKQEKARNCIFLTIFTPFQMGHS